jgi:Mg2+-importing ATPase
VGISADTAVDTAKESADAILLGKSLLVLEEGVLGGRKVFANTLKYVRMGPAPVTATWSTRWPCNRSRG